MSSKVDGIQYSNSINNDHQILTGEESKNPTFSNYTKRKRKLSENLLSTVLSVAQSPFRKQQKKRHCSMGSACTKGSKVHISKPDESQPNGRLSTGFDKRGGRVAPSPTEEKELHQLNELKPLFENRLSVDHITLHSYSDVNVRDQSLRIEEEEKEEEEIGSIENKENNETIIHTSSSRSSSEYMDVVTKDKQCSLPDLRTKEKCKRVTRSCSHGDTQLKGSIGSTNLLLASTSFTHRKERNEIPRHHSSDNVLATHRRKKRVPTVENGIHMLEANQVNSYQILEEIGRGSFGSVCRCMCYEDNKYYAMKIISKKRLMRKTRMLARHPNNKSNPLGPLRREIAILKKMDHPNIVKLVEVIDDIQVDNVYMVFELMQNGVVIEVPSEHTIPEDRSRRLFRELLLGIEYLHYSKIIHRDIKPSNLLLDNNDHIKIADFGVSNMFEGDNDLLSKYAGSPAFQSPEVLNHESRDKYSGKAADVWAMGVTLYCFLFGNCPFVSSNLGELIKQIKNEPVIFPNEPIVNPQAQDLISRMLSKEAKDRINIEEMKEHSWVTEGGCCKLPSTEEHCSVIEVTDEEVRNSIRMISKLSSLVLAKSVLKGRTFVGSICTKAGWKRNHSMPTNSLSTS